MGVDALYQAAPLTWELLGRAKQDVQACKGLTLAIHLLRDFEREGTPWSEYEHTPEGMEVRQLVAQYPGIETRNCELESRWDILHYLLSESGRKGAFDAELGTAVYGGPPINEDFEQLSFTPPPKVRDVAVELEQIAPDYMRQFYDPRQMAEEHLYVEDRDAVWSLLCRDLTKLQRLYAAAAAHGESVLVYIF